MLCFSMNEVLLKAGPGRRSACPCESRCTARGRSCAPLGLAGLLRTTSLIWRNQYCDRKRLRRIGNKPRVQSRKLNPCRDPFRHARHENLRVTRVPARGGAGQVVDKHLASALRKRAIYYAIAMQPPLASYYWPGLPSDQAAQRCGAIRTAGTGPPPGWTTRPGFWSAAETTR